MLVRAVSMAFKLPLPFQFLRASMISGAFLLHLNNPICVSWSSLFLGGVGGGKKSKQMKIEEGTMTMDDE